MYAELSHLRNVIIKDSSSPHWAAVVQPLHGSYARQTSFHHNLQLRGLYVGRLATNFALVKYYPLFHLNRRPYPPPRRAMNCGSDATRHIGFYMSI